MLLSQPPLRIYYPHQYSRVSPQMLHAGMSPSLSPPSRRLPAGATPVYRKPSLGFWDCVPTEKFMEKLTWFAPNHKNATSVWLPCAVIGDWRGKSPSITSIHELEKYVPAVDIRIVAKVLTDLAWRFLGRTNVHNTLLRTSVIPHM